MAGFMADWEASLSRSGVGLRTAMLKVTGCEKKLPRVASVADTIDFTVTPCRPARRYRGEKLTPRE